MKIIKFIKAGIFEADTKYPDKHLRKHLRALDEAGELWKIPYVQADRKTQNRKWYFIPISNATPQQQTTPTIEKKSVKGVTRNISSVKAEATPSRICSTKSVADSASFAEIERRLIHGAYTSANSLNSSAIPQNAGIYCIKLREGVHLPINIGKVREDRIIYIGKATNMYKRLWQEELKHKRAATFFRSVGAVLGYLPPKGSLKNSDSRNYKFSEEDTQQIIKWMRQSLTVNYVILDSASIEDIESKPIKKYTPLINITNNPNKSDVLESLRAKCVLYAKS